MAALFEKWNEDESIGVWVAKSPVGYRTPFCWTGITPSSNPCEYPTGAKTLEEAIKSATWQFDQWIEGFTRRRKAEQVAEPAKTAGVKISRETLKAVPPAVLAG